jgi:hypothetical protein
LNYDKRKYFQTTWQTTLRVPPVVSEPPVEKHVGDIKAMKCEWLDWIQLTEMCLLVEFCEVNDNPSDVTKPWNFKTFQYKVAQITYVF